MNSTPALGRAPGVSIRPAKTLALDQRPLDSVLTGGLLIVLIFGVLAFGAADTWATSLLEIGSALLFGLWAVQQLVAGRVVVRRNPLYGAVVGFALLIAAQLAMRITIYRYATLEEALRYCAYGMLFFVAAQVLRHSAQIQRFAIVLTGFGALLSIFAIAQDLTTKDHIYWTVHPVFPAWAFGPYVNHNHWAGLMELLSPIPLVLLADRNRRRPVQALLAFATLLMTSTIFLCGSRGGMMAITCEAFFLCTVLMARSEQRRSHLLLVAAAAISLVAFVAWVNGPRVAARIGEVQDIQSDISGTEWGRLVIYKDTLRMAKARPIAGWGLDTFSIMNQEFRSFYTAKVIDHAHNDYLQVLAETGLIGFGFVVWFIVQLFRSGLQQGWEEQTTATYARLAGLTACVGILVHSLVDFNLHIPANAAMFYVMAALATAPVLAPRVRLHPFRQHVK